MSNTTKAEPAKTEKKIGLMRFLQFYPQVRGVEALLRSKYASAVKTENEWNTVVNKLLHSKTK